MDHWCSAAAHRSGWTRVAEGVRPDAPQWERGAMWEAIAATGSNASDEEIARFALRDEFRQDAGIRTRDEQRVRILALLRQLTKQLPVIAELFVAEFVDAFDELFEGSRYLLAWADSLEEIKTICHCGRKATMKVPPARRTEGYMIPLRPRASAESATALPIG